MRDPGPAPIVCSAPQKRVDAFLEKARGVGVLPAFSEKSLTEGMKAGLFDSEAYRQLKRVSLFPERRDAYGRKAGDPTMRDLPPDPDQTVEASLVTVSGDGAPVLSSSASAPGILSPLDTAAFSIDASHHIDRVQKAMDDDASASKASSPAARRVSRYAQRGAIRRRTVQNTMADLIKPHYTMADVDDFKESFHLVDVDLSGMIDMDEWFLFLGRMNQHLTPVEAQLLFLHLDKDRDGCLTMRELMSIVFSRLPRSNLEGLHKHLWDQHIQAAADRKRRNLEQLVKQNQRKLLGTQATTRFDDGSSMEGSSVAPPG